MRAQPVVAVVTFRRGNVGGTMLCLHFEPGWPFVLQTGPNPWGGGVWGPFDADALVSARPLKADDSWAFPGCPSERWNAADLVRSRRQCDLLDDDATKRLEAAIAAVAP
jgi:hypothetical protein